MRSLLFIALIGLALAVPVPVAQPDSESDIFYESELPEDCYEDETIDQAAYTEDDLHIDAINEDSPRDEDCDDEPIVEQDLVDIVIDYEPADDEQDVIYQRYEQEPEAYDDDCVDDIVTEDPPTMAPKVETTEEYINNEDCYGEEGDAIEDEDYFSYEEEKSEQLEPLDSFDQAYVEVDKVFQAEFEGEADSIEECIEY